MKILWNGSRAHEEFFDVVKSPSMNHPEVSDVTRVLGVGILYETPIKPHEKNGSSNPGDSHGDVEPTPQKL
jgi:hypothetical protein